ncbi:hypothetical protein [Sphingomonas sp. RS2018]
MRVLVEVLHIAIGLAAAALIVATAVWAYPLARHEIETTGWVAAVIIVLLGIRPLLAAYRIDRETLRK